MDKCWHIRTIQMGRRREVRSHGRSTVLCPIYWPVHCTWHACPSKCMSNGIVWIATSERVPSDMCTQRRFRSTCAFTQFDQSSWCILINKDAKFLHMDKKDSDQIARMSSFGAFVRRYVFPYWDSHVTRRDQIDWWRQVCQFISNP